MKREEDQSALSIVTWNWPTRRQWTTAGALLILLLLVLRQLTGIQDIFTFPMVLVLVGLLYQPGKSLRIVEAENFMNVQTAYAWNIVRRRNHFHTDFATTQSAISRAIPWELSWQDWWSAVKHGGRIERLEMHAILVGFRRRGIAIPVEADDAKLAVNFNIVASGKVTTTREWSIGWGLIQRQTSKMSEQLPATFVFVPTEISMEDIRQLGSS